MIWNGVPIYGRTSGHALCEGTKVWPFGSNAFESFSRAELMGRVDVPRQAGPIARPLSLLWT